MRAGDRIDLIRRLADRLVEPDLSWEDVDLMLRSFGMELIDPDHWNGSSRGLILAELETGSDAALRDLEDYLSGGSGSRPDPDDLQWQAGMLRVFLSHTHDKAELAGKIREFFALWQIDVFVAHTSIEPTREWQRVIEASLGTCDAPVALITDGFQASAWCDQEVGYALGRGVPVIPVKLGRDPHGFISKYQAPSPVQNSPARVADGIFRALAHHRDLGQAMAAPVIHRFATTRNFDGARANFKLISDLPAGLWTRELVTVAERAIQENRQLTDAVIVEPETEPLPQATQTLLAPIRAALGMDVPVAPGSADDDIPF